ncbi:MAG: hypothetical protein ACOX8B_03665 [Lachnospiraceae bacterium]|jgi:hypothetical protein
MGEMNAKNTVARETMDEVHRRLETPVKKGLVLSEEGTLIDCPNVFRRKDGLFGMVYVRFEPKSARPGYETWLALSSDLLHWEPQGKLLTAAGLSETGEGSDGQSAEPARAVNGWDSCQKDGSLCLIDPDWGGTLEPEKWNGKYWMTYIGGNRPGYEPDPLRIGAACGGAVMPGAFRCLPDPVLAENDPDARPFERTTLYKSCVIHDRGQTLGAPLVMFYNAKSQPYSIERIGIAVSSDMTHWKRYGDDAVLGNGIFSRWNIAGDPQVSRMDDLNLWVMNYYVAMDGTAWDTFACSEDLVHWTPWDGEPLVRPSESFDAQYAHKPFVFRYGGTVYHFYCAATPEGRGIALAVSR